MEVKFTWEDGGCAGIKEIICQCGNISRSETCQHGEIYCCEKCGKKIKFIWKGMTYEETE